MCHFAGIGQVIECFGAEKAEILTDKVITTT